VPTTTIPVGAELRPAVLRHLPLVRHTIDHLGIHRTIDRLLPKDGRMDVSDAECVDLMIINILHGRVALYKMGESGHTPTAGPIEAAPEWRAFGRLPRRRGARGDGARGRPLQGPPRTRTGRA